MKADSLALALLMILCGLIALLIKHARQYAPYILAAVLMCFASHLHPLPFWGG